MEAVWNLTPRNIWDARLAARPAALQQDWAYGEAMAHLGAGLLRAHVHAAGAPIALAQFIFRRHLGVAHVALCTRGPVWLADLEPRDKAEAFKVLRRTAPFGGVRALLFTPDETDPAPARAARLLRVMTGMSMVRLDLTASEDALLAAQHGKWRNRLRLAQGGELVVRRNGVKPAQYQWLLDAEAKQRGERGYIGLPAGFVTKFANAKGAREGLRIWRAETRSEAAAAILVLRHGASATYHLGWTSEAGRKLGAHNLLLWEAIRALKAEGVQAFDLGGVDTVKSPGLARFKLGAGGQPVTLCGTWACT